MCFWAARWQQWPDHEFFCVRDYRKDVHDYMLDVWFEPEQYDTAKKRHNCLRKLHSEGLRFVKVRVVAVESQSDG